MYAISMFQKGLRFVTLIAVLSVTLQSNFLPYTSARAFTTSSVDQSSTPNFTYHIAASFSPKKRPYFDAERETFYFDPAGAQLNEKNLPNAGQDAFFVSKAGPEGCGSVALGVTDGVGGYDHDGFDSAFFSRALATKMGTAALYAEDKSPPAQGLIEAAYYDILDEGRIEGGGSTAVACVARSDGVLNCANLGDSGFLILRQGRVQYASPHQQHYFNAPYQLAAIPKSERDQLLRYGTGHLADSPEDAAVTNHLLQDGDVLVFASDGLFDNLSTQRILRIVSDEMTFGKGWTVSAKQGYMPSQNLDTLVDGEKPIQAAVSKALVTQAKSTSQNPKIDTPFGKEWRRARPSENWRGGKVDDIVVICVVVTAQ